MKRREYKKGLRCRMAHTRIGCTRACIHTYMCVYGHAPAYENARTHTHMAQPYHLAAATDSALTPPFLSDKGGGGNGGADAVGVDESESESENSIKQARAGAPSANKMKSNQQKKEEGNKGPRTRSVLASEGSRVRSGGEGNKA